MLYRTRQPLVGPTLLHSKSMVNICGLTCPLESWFILLLLVLDTAHTIQIWLPWLEKRPSFMSSVEIGLGIGSIRIRLTKHPSSLASLVSLLLAVGNKMVMW